MPPITALLHTENDALRLGRCLETLYACDEILIVDHASTDGTLRIAREYGARVVHAGRGDFFHQSPQFDAPGWILAIEPQESLTESLAASLFAWKSEWKTDSGSALSFPAFSVFLREERVGGWAGASAAQTRLVPGTWTAWKGNLPIHEPSAIALRGELLRFAFP
jgi:glycosyltransferase involved in cell wall biosynthesis